MGKGYTTEGWGEILIVVIIFVLFLFAIYGILVEFWTSMSGAVAVSSSAKDLTAAINKVSRCIDNYGAGCCTESELVSISLPQNIRPQTDPGSGYDPLWTIYHDYCFSRENEEGNPESCRDIDNTKPYLVREADCECKSLWDMGKYADRCTDDLCWGLIEKQEPGVSELDESAVAKLKPFYMTDPCYAVVMVHEDPDDPGMIDICYYEDLDGPGYYNWCFSEWHLDCMGDLGDDSIWPQNEYSVWNTGYKNHEDYHC